MFRFLPEGASEQSPNIDWIHNLITDLSVFFTVAIVGAMIYFAIRYRQRDGKDHETPRIEGSHTLEAFWTIMPTIVCIFLGYYSVTYYQDFRRVPKDALSINVTGQKWFWSFQYENGKEVSGKNVEFVVPVDKPIKLVLTSKDTIHSFFIPAMRVKADAIPNRFTYLSFRPVKTGEYVVFCTVYCGREHSNMMATIKVVSPAEYERWVNDRSAELALAALSPYERGKALYVSKGCNSCHSLDGTKIVGPSYLKSWGHQGKFTDGTSYEMNEEYVRESILEPGKHIVEGYANLMPANYSTLTTDEISSLIAFIKAQDGTNVETVVAKVAAPVDDAAWAKMTPAERGKAWYTAKAAPACSSCHSIDGSKLVGPSFKGLYGSKHEVEGGTEIVADDAYITESIKMPAAKVVKGYPNAMPPVYAAQLKDDDIKDIIEFIKTLK